MNPDKHMHTLGLAVLSSTALRKALLLSKPNEQLLVAFLPSSVCLHRQPALQCAAEWPSSHPYSQIPNRIPESKVFAGLIACWSSIQPNRHL